MTAHSASACPCSVSARARLRSSRGSLSPDARPASRSKASADRRLPGPLLLAEDARSIAACEEAKWRSQDKVPVTVGASYGPVSQRPGDGPRDLELGTFGAAASVSYGRTRGRGKSAGRYSVSCRQVREVAWAATAHSNAGNTVINEGAKARCLCIARPCSVGLAVGAGCMEVIKLIDPWMAAQHLLQVTRAP